jgi:hypothetical protein
MKAIFPHEKFSFISFMHMFLSNAFNDSLIALKIGVFWRNFPSILSFRFTQFWGTFRGYSQHGAVSKALRQKFYYPNDSQEIGSSGRAPERRTAMIDYSGHGGDS